MWKLRLLTARKALDLISPRVFQKSVSGELPKGRLEFEISDHCLSLFSRHGTSKVWLETNGSQSTSRPWNKQPQTYRLVKPGPLISHHTPSESSPADPKLVVVTCYVLLTSLWHLLLHSGSGKAKPVFHFATPTYSLAHLRHKENHFRAIRTGPSAEPIQRAWLPFCWPIASLQWWHQRGARTGCHRWHDCPFRPSLFVSLLGHGMQCLYPA